jgi:hypothetical protein
MRPTFFTNAVETAAKRLCEEGGQRREGRKERK